MKTKNKKQKLIDFLGGTLALVRAGVDLASWSKADQHNGKVLVLYSAQICSNFQLKGVIYGNSSWRGKMEMENFNIVFLIPSIIDKVTYLDVVIYTMS